MNLVLRNRVADWCLAALRDEAAEAPIAALASFAETADAEGVAAHLPESHAAILEASGLFERTAAGLRLRADLARDLGPLRWRAERFAEALSTWRARRAASVGKLELPPALRAAACLFNARLFFEVHELLEGYWREADGDLQAFLQGLIQVAVGFHHHANGNIRGAIALLEEGNAKLLPFAPAAQGVELGELCSAIGEIARELRRAACPTDVTIPELVVR